MLFAEFKSDQKRRSLLRQEVAEEMYELIKTFDGNEAIENMNSFKMLITVFHQQCELSADITVSKDTDDKDDSNDTDGTNVTIKKSPGADVIQNPSDIDATYDGHKGQGYQIQLTETCNPNNEVQLIVSAIPQTAAESDSEAVKLVLHELREKDLLPELLLADTLYGSDENSEGAKKDGVILISPVPGQDPKKTPKKITAKTERLRVRRQMQLTETWRNQYKIRAQEEGIIGCIKRKTGMVRLRYRGSPRMFMSMVFKTLGWNISQAYRSAKIQRKIAQVFV